MAALETKVEMTKDWLIAQMRARVSAGMKSGDAADEVVAEVARLKQEAEAWRAVGRSILPHLYAQSAEIARMYVERGIQRGPGERRVNVTLLQREESFFEMEIHVPGVGWIKFGDMDRQDCLAKAAAYDMLASTTGRRAKAMRAIAQRLEGDAQHVRDKWTEPEVRAVYEGLGLAKPLDEDESK